MYLIIIILYLSGFPFSWSIVFAGVSTYVCSHCYLVLHFCICSHLFTFFYFDGHMSWPQFLAIANSAVINMTFWMFWWNTCKRFVGHVSRNGIAEPWDMCIFNLAYALFIFQSFFFLLIYTHCLVAPHSYPSRYFKNVSTFGGGERWKICQYLRSTWDSTQSSLIRVPGGQTQELVFLKISPDGTNVYQRRELKIISIQMRWLGYEGMKCFA